MGYARQVIEISSSSDSDSDDSDEDVKPHTSSASHSAPARKRRPAAGEWWYYLSVSLGNILRIRVSFCIERGERVMMEETLWLGKLYGR